MKLPTFFRTQKFYSIFNSVFNAAIALVTLGLLARLLTKEDFGHWAFFLAIVGFIEMALNGLVRTPVIRMAANKEDYKYREVLASAWDILIKTVLGIGALSALVCLWIFWITDDLTYLQYSYWLPLYLVGTLPQLIGIWNSNALMRFQRILVIRLITALCFLLGVLYITFIDGGLSIVFWSYIIATALASVIVMLKGWASFRFYLTHRKSYRKEMLNYGKFSMGTALSSTALGNSDSFLIMYFLGPVALAIYEIPKRIKGIYDIPLRSVLQLTYPYLSKKSGLVNDVTFRKEVNGLLGFTFMLLFPVALLIFLFAENLVFLLGGEEYADAVIVLKIFAMYLLITPLDRFSGVILDVLNRPNVNFQKVLIMLFVNIVGDITVIKLGYGVAGVAAVTLATVSAGILYGFWMHRHAVPLNPTGFFVGGIQRGRQLVKEVFIKN